jgi:hypothetical protein
MNSDNLPIKLGIKPNTKAFLLHAPSDYKELLPAASIATIEELDDESDWVQAFYPNTHELNAEVSALKSKLGLNGQLWISWPKKSSGLKSDLSDQIVRQAGLEVGLVDVKVVSINETWSGLKFVYRKSDR